MTAEPLFLEIGGVGGTSGLWLCPASPVSCLVLAHGAGAGMTHKSLAALADGLHERGVASLRYQFPYMERGSKRVDPPEVAMATVRAAVQAARVRAGPVALFAGGRSFGGRMTSQAQAASPLDGVRGLVFFSFPLHPAGKPAIDRAAHLSAVAVPMLFVQGEADALADRELLLGVLRGLGARAEIISVPSADHSLHVPARSGRTDAAVLGEALDQAAWWMRLRAASASAPGV